MSIYKNQQHIWHIRLFKEFDCNTNTTKYLLSPLLKFKSLQFMNLGQFSLALRSGQFRSGQKRYS